MEFTTQLKASIIAPISCIEMHTTGEPTRIVVSGFPDLQGSLMDQRTQAKEKYDHIRRMLMLEPRGHNDMYGAVLRQDTELVHSGEAHIGVLFMHNEGFSTMCGHATIALGRFLVDVHDANIFPNRHTLYLDPATKTVELNLHAPCGLIRITIPTTADGESSDPTRPVSFRSIPSFSVAISLQVPIPISHQWPQLKSRPYVTVDLSYGGALYAIVSAKELGFTDGLQRIELDAMSNATRRLKEVLRTSSELNSQVNMPGIIGLANLYSVMLVDSSIGVPVPDTEGVETGLCFFANQQIDRSPTGGCVIARMALAYAKGERAVGQRWTYNSIVSNRFAGKDSFVGTILETTTAADSGGISEGVIVKVEGKAYYTGKATYILEDSDTISAEGLSLHDL